MPVSFLLQALFFQYLLKNATPINAEITINIRAMAIGPHNGAVIHHHDHVITPHSFKIKNTIKSNVVKEIESFIY